MQELRVVGVEDGALIVASDDGTRYGIPVEDVLKAGLRQAPVDHGTSRRIAPKDIQAHIRSGMSAQDVASITGAPIEYIQRFEGPVLAEREFVVQSALDVPVRTAGDTDPLAQAGTFGIAIRERLAGLGASGERWSSWKEAAGGWVVKLSFTAEQIVAKRGNLKIEYPSNVQSKKLWGIVESNFKVRELLHMPEDDVYANRNGMAEQAG